MGKEKLERWSNLLLDLGKGNNLVNYKDKKSSTLEVIAPKINTIFEKLSEKQSYDVYITPTEKKEKNPFALDSEGIEHLSKTNYLNRYEPLLGKNQILLYSISGKSLQVLRYIYRNAENMKSEKGINILYMAFGFVNYTEKNDSETIYKAPLLLMPINLTFETATSGISIKPTEDDIVVNPTFAFKLSQDRGIDLPLYDDDMTLDQYVNLVSKAVERFGWKVEKTARISTFTFQKINMYLDMRENSNLIQKNKIVSALLKENSSISLKDLEIMREQIQENKDFDITSLNTVVDADKSQCEAIALARTGVNMVLQGPPGTGKSQTITNMIAEFLAQDKKVLFVSEKLAALNVVYSKLKKLGLEEFCLELHSHKLNKKAVIEDLYNTLTNPPTDVNSSVLGELDNLKNVKTKLDTYAVELHKTLPIINKSLYEIYTEVGSLRNFKDINYRVPDIENRNEDYLDKVELLISQYSGFMQTIGTDYRKYCWYPFADSSVTFENISFVEKNLKDFLDYINEVKEILPQIKQKSIFAPRNIEQIEEFVDICRVLKENEFLVPSLIKKLELEDNIEFLNKIESLAARLRECDKIISDIFDEEVFKLDTSLLIRKLERNFTSPMKRKLSSEYKKLRADVTFTTKDNIKLKYEEMISYLKTVEELKKLKEEFSKYDQRACELLGEVYNSFKTDFKSIANDFSYLNEIYSSSHLYREIKMFDDEDYKNAQTYLFSYYASLKNLTNKYNEAIFYAKAKFPKKVVNIFRMDLNPLFSKILECLRSIDNFTNYLTFLKVIDNLENENVDGFIIDAINNNIKAEELVGTYKKLFYSQWGEYALNNSNFLSAMNRIVHDNAVEIFKEKDLLGFEINKAKIRSQLTHNRPDLQTTAPTAGVSLILKEQEKKRKQKSIKELFSEAKETIMTLKPCFLMSPLSVSTYLPSNMQFDVVIFDEASQIFPQDAIGAIYRSKQLIVVGDSKQMPPSNFFNNSNESDDDDENDINNFESILDVCNILFLQKSLSWHYRSKNEDLIAFSNKHFYRNNLMTFPSTLKNKQDIGVEYYHVDGIFESSSKTNEKEADKVVELLFKSLEEHPDKSVGVVAFSVSQQTLIERKIYEKFIKKPSLEKLFFQNKDEPVFIKNLETVQGDERDVIIFSIAYGKRSDGKIYLNFGPLNKEGGERRLNVAVTRAKYNLKVVSSLYYNDIDTTRTSNLGPALLRDYLEYAQKGSQVLDLKDETNEVLKVKNEFESEVADFLSANGYKVETQVGCGSYRVDVAVKDKKDEKYVIAIECDGYNYLNSHSTRDRDRLRQSVLEAMGWKFIRIWSTDWYRNNRIEKQRLLHNVKNIFTGKNVPFNADSYVATNGVEGTESRNSNSFIPYTYLDAKSLAKEYENNPNKVISRIISTEAPIHEDWLCKRLCFLFGREKLTSIVRDKVINYLKEEYPNRDELIFKDGFIYQKNVNTLSLRVKNPDDEVIRDFKHIPIDELTFGVHEYLKEKICIEKQILIRELNQKLGVPGVGPRIVERYEECLKKLANKISINDDGLIYYKGR